MNKVRDIVSEREKSDREIESERTKTSTSEIREEESEHYKIKHIYLSLGPDINLIIDYIQLFHD